MDTTAITTQYPEMKPSDLKDLCSALAKAKLPLLVIGKPGIGKSDIIAQVAKSIDYDLIVSHPVVDDPVDYKGMPFTWKDEASARQRAGFLPFADLERLMTVTKPTIHFADDLGQAAKLTQAAYMQFMLNRSLNGHKISDDVVFFAASNRKEDKAGVSGMLEPLKDRYATIIELCPDVEDWVGWAIGNDMPFELISYVRYRPEILADWKPTSDFTRTATPRSLAYVGKILKTGLPNHLLRRTFTGAIGKERASEFIGFLGIYKDLPDPMDVILNPKTAPLPKDAAASYALCGALSARVTGTTIEAIIEYSNRLKDEFSVLLVRDSIMRNREGLCSNAKFITWVHKHQDVLI